MYTTANTVFFLVGVFVVSLMAFGLMLVIPSAQSPEGLPGLPVWLVAIWSPTIVAIILAVRAGRGRDLLGKLGRLRGTGPAFLIGLVPLLIFVAVVLLSNRSPDWSRLPLTTVFALVGLNLFLGPLGEELGWRGYLQPALTGRLGWLRAALVVGVIWALWHAPLWLIDSPQSQIPYPVFLVHVVAYSLLIGAAWSLAPHSLLPAVVLHLLFNLVSGVALILGITGIGEWYEITALPFGIAALAVVSLVQFAGISATAYANSG